MNVIKCALACASMGLPVVAHSSAHADIFESWTELAGSGCFDYGVSEDYHITDYTPDNGMLVMAIHGGDLEPKTAELAKLVAGGPLLDLFSGLYALEVHNEPEWCAVQGIGFFQTATSHLHVSSSNYDEESARTMAEDHRVVVSIHGMADKNKPGNAFPQYAICVGGRNATMRDRFIELVRDNPTLDPVRVIDAAAPSLGGPAENDDGVVITAADRCSDAVSPLGGIDWDNIANVGDNAEGGLQLEMSRSLRRALYDQGPDGSGPWDDYLEIRGDLVDVIRQVMEEENAWRLELPSR